ncbi:MAG: carbohydrate kinase [Candidatus Neoclostridium sp.]
MILSIGEILADLIGEQNGDRLFLEAHLGGAPFNVAVNAKQEGARVAFLGKVGRDPVGRFLTEQAKKAALDRTDVLTDDEKNTTLAFVTLKDGERDFSFFRSNAADYDLDDGDVDLSSYADLNIVHVGSLMLSEPKGRRFASQVVKKIRDCGKIFSFDVNFRSDIFDGVEEAKKIYSPFIEQADILKFSEDELVAFTGENRLEKAVKLLYKPNRLLLVTLGSRGSAYFYNQSFAVIPTTKVNPVDTTGAGDAFFGAVLAHLDGKPFTEENIRFAVQKGNRRGAAATQFKGAIKL